MEELRDPNVLFMNPFLALDNADALKVRLYDELSKHFDVTKEEIDHAVDEAYKEAAQVRKDVQAKGEETLAYLAETGKMGIVLCGRPYHIDPEINHGIPELINSFGIAVLSEDSICHLGHVERPLIVSDRAYRRQPAPNPASGASPARERPVGVPFPPVPGGGVCAHARRPGADPA
jgi:predicted nucleotide-binding protein (sugar kinase/HSP70/actin superfamily)